MIALYRLAFPRIGALLLAITSLLRAVGALLLLTSAALLLLTIAALLRAAGAVLSVVATSLPRISSIIALLVGCGLRPLLRIRPVGAVGIGGG